jgi:hypothetical protein
MDGARTHDDQQAIILAMQYLVNGPAGLSDEFFHRTVVDGEKTDEVFWWRQHSDVLDALIVGLTGFFVAGLVSNIRHLSHGFLVVENKKKPPETGGWWGFDSGWLQTSRPPVGREK